MPLYHIHLTTPLARTFRTEQVAGMFDLPRASSSSGWRTRSRPSCPGSTATGRSARLSAPPAAARRRWPGRRMGRRSTTRRRGRRRWRLLRPSTNRRAANCGLRIADCGLRDCPPIRNPQSAIRNCPTSSARSRPSAFPARRAGSSPTACSARASGSGRIWRGRCLTNGKISRRVRSAEEEDRQQHLCASAPLRESIPVLVFDEFTSSLDRTVACTASASLGKFLRQRSASNPQSEIRNPKFVCPLLPHRFPALA